MVNLMYIVLTAMLALNVSAEIMNAFFALDKGLDKTSDTLKLANANTVEGMRKTVEVKKEYAPLLEKADAAKEITNSFISYIDELRDHLVDESGNRDGSVTEEDYDPKTNLPKGKKDKDAPNRIFVEGGSAKYGDAPQGEILFGEILETRRLFQEMATGMDKLDISSTNITKEEIEQYKAAIPLDIDSAFALTDKSWTEYNFGHMPVAAVLPMLNKLKNDAHNSEAALQNFLSSKMTKQIPPDSYSVFAMAPKSYLLQGDTYTAQLGIGAYSSQAKIDVLINGRRVNVRDGLASYSVPASSVGKKTYKAEINIKNPLTGKTETIHKTFKYEVGAPSAAINLQNMNVFYVGVDNPIDISVSGIASEKIKVKSSNNISLGNRQGTKYTVKAKRPSQKETITLNADGLSNPITFEYRVLPIPDPTPLLAGKKWGRKIGANTLRKMITEQGIKAKIPGFLFPVKVEVKEFDFVYVGNKSGSFLEENNKGSKPSKSQTKRALKQAKAGDLILLNSIKAKVPGRSKLVDIGDLSFKLK